MNVFLIILTIILGSLYLLVFSYAMVFMMVTAARTAWYGDVRKRKQHEADRP